MFKAISLNASFLISFKTCHVVLGFYFLLFIAFYLYICKHF